MFVCLFVCVCVCVCVSVCVSLTVEDAALVALALGVQAELLEILCTVRRTGRNLLLSALQHSASLVLSVTAL